jgi:putative oxidoreductase
MRRLFYPDCFTASVSLGLLLLRLVVGVAFLFHGWPKMQKPLDWIPYDTAIPGFLQAAAAVAEFGGGAALILGLLTRLAALGLAVTMLVAAGLHISNGDPFVSMSPPSWELAAVYLACSLLFLFAGPGCFSLDALLFGSAGRSLNASPG